MSKVLDAVAAALHNQADANKDGKLDKQDVDIAVEAVRRWAVSAETHLPLGTLVVVAVMAFVLGMVFVRLTGKC